MLKSAFVAAAAAFAALAAIALAAIVPTAYAISPCV